MKKLFWLLLVPIALVLRPVPKPKDSNQVWVADTLLRAGGSKTYDLHLNLKENSDFFYLNRVLEKSPELLDQVQNHFGKPVRLAYIKHWTPLDPFSKHHHVSCLILARDTLWQEK